MSLKIRYSMCVLWLLSGTLSAQVLPVGTPVLEDYYRREQLLGRLDPDISFSVRPMTAATLQRADLFFPDTTVGLQSSGWHSGDGHGHFRLLPAVWQQQVNSSYPVGYNDGGMIPARGYQTLMSAGFFAKYRFLSIQVMPEVVLAQNSVYEGFGGPNGPDEVWYRRIGTSMPAAS